MKKILFIVLLIFISCSFGYDNPVSPSEIKDTTICITLSCPVNDTIYADILAGQSNAVGWNTASVSSLGLYLTSPIHNALIYNPNTDSIETLECGVNNQAYPNSGSIRYCGVELGYMSSMVGNGKPRLMVKYAIGGTLLYKYTSGSDWNTQSTGEYYDQLISRINAAKAQAIRQGYKIKFKNLIWWQGEADAASPVYAAAYKANLCSLICELRNDLSESELNIVIVRITDYTGWSDRATIRAVQEQVADSLSNVEWLDTDFYAPGVVHKNANQYTYIGGDLINKVKK